MSDVSALPVLSTAAQDMILQRPAPPDDLTDISAEFDHFEPARKVMDWIQDAYLGDNAPLYTHDHAHLRNARIGVLWTNAENAHRGLRIVGQAECLASSGGGGKWQKARSTQQLREWFGHPLPEFLITLDALWAVGCDDASFAALVDHELYHCAQATDSFGMPRFNQQTGEPLWMIRGHDVEEFVGVVRRFGIEAAGEKATEMVIAAATAPEITGAGLARACGTCVRKAA